MNAMPTSVLLIGCGKMGGAMLAGWMEREAGEVVVVTPRPTSVPEAGRGVTVVPDAAGVPARFRPDVIVLATKPQQADAALVECRPFLRRGVVVMSIMAGRTVAQIAAGLGAAAPVVRAMPNTPAALRQSFTCCHAGPGVTEAQRGLADALLRTVGEVAWVEDEGLMDVVTAVSGGGPAYVFLLAELLERAAIDQGLPPGLARRMTRSTVAGAGAQLGSGGDDAAQLRINVTSPKGTTEQALAVLMAPGGWPDLMQDAIAAATHRSRQLGTGG
jgi:pyrroline-5-carboxylate reductase